MTVRLGVSMRCLAALLLLLTPGLAFGQAAGQTPRTLPGATKCAIDLPAPGPDGGWTDAEKYAWQQLCLTGWVDMRRAGEENGLACNPAKIKGEIPEHRVLRHSFLEFILTEERWTETLSYPSIEIYCANINDSIILDDRSVYPYVGIYQSKINGGLSLLGTYFKRTLNLTGTTVTELINADRIKVEGGLFLRGGGLFNGIELIGSEIYGDVSAIGSTFTEKFNADRMKVGGNLFLSDGAKFKDVDLLGAKIGVDLSADGSIFNGLFNADGIKVDGYVFLRNESYFKDFQLLSARVGRGLQLGNSRFEGIFDMTGAKIEGELLLSSARHGAPKWGEDAKLILRNVSVDALQAEPSAWKREEEWLPTELTGFTYNRLGGLNAHESDTMADEEAGWLIEWIENQEGHADRYDPHPYEQLSQALERAGAVDKAKAVRFAKLEHKREAANTDAQTAKLLWWSKWLLGHGVYPFRVLLWFSGLVLLGTIIAMFSRDPVIGRPPNPLWYSLENSLPLVELAERYKNPNHDRLFFNSFFHLQKVLGFGLATIMVGALTLLGSD